MKESAVAHPGRVSMTGVQNILLLEKESG